MNKLPDIIQFSNIETKLQFQAQVNKTICRSIINSITFYYNMDLPIKILDISNDFNIAIDKFEDFIFGRVYGGVFIDKYNDEETKTYLMYDGFKYKIGKSIDPNKRLSTIRTSNPTTKLLAYSKHVTENFLHKAYEHRNIGGEWFKLSDSDIKTISTILSIDNSIAVDVLTRMCLRNIKKNTKTNFETKKEVKKIKEHQKILNAVFTFGKYKNKSVSEMNTEAETNYLFWAYNNLGNLNKDLKSSIAIKLKISNA